MLPERDAYVHFVTIESLLGRVLLDHARTNTERERDIETERQTDREYSCSTPVTQQTGSTITAPL